MGFAEELRAFTVTMEATEQAVFVNTVSHVHQSIVDGSPVTGAPGQPVDTGSLRDSWQIVFESPTSALVSTNVAYARPVEDNVYDVTFHNHGPHSVKLTRAGFQRIIDTETAAARGAVS